MLDNPNYDKKIIEYLKHSMIKSAYKQNPTETWEKELNQKIDNYLDNNSEKGNSKDYSIVSFVGSLGDGKSTLYKQLSQDVATELGLNFIHVLNNTGNIKPTNKDFLLISYESQEASFFNSPEEQNFDFNVINNAAAGTVLFEDAHTLSKKNQLALLEKIKDKPYHFSLTLNSSHKDLVNQVILNRTICANSKETVLRQITNVRFNHSQSSETNLKPN